MSRGQQGFTLIEIMVVMVILSFGLVGVVAAVAQVARTTSTIEEFESLRQVAEHVLATQLLDGKFSTGRTEGELKRVRWVLEVIDDPDFLNLRQLSITTFAISRPEDRQFRLESRQALLGTATKEAL